MKLKGEWDSGTTYDVGDIVRYTDGVMFHLQKPCAAGITPYDTLYWGRCEKDQEALSMMCDMMVGIPKNLSDDALSLKTETSEYLITVDDSGDTPELTVTEIEDGE